MRCYSQLLGAINGQRSVRLLLLCSLLFLQLMPAWAVQEKDVLDGPDVGITQAELQAIAAESSAEGNAQKSAKPFRGSLNFLALLIEGGALMIPIAVMSLLVVAVTLERWLALRRSRLFPRRLRKEIRRAAEDGSTLSPPELYRTAELFPSVGARVLKDLLQKVGRPIPEVELSIGEGVQREADNLYGNVRWLTLAAAVTPLIGLLGTVWGMIIAFYNTSQLGSGSNKAEFLAEGIYVALVTTLAGLAVAIPAAIFAHYFEGRITKSLGLIESEVRRLVPKLEEFEGRMRYDISSRGIALRETARREDRHLHESKLPPPPVIASGRKG